MNEPMVDSVSERAHSSTDSDFAYVSSPDSPLPWPLRWLGPILAACFGLGAVGRKILYRLGLKKSRRASLVVVSIGNLTAGGTGKTPMAIYLAEQLVERKMSYRPAIIMRGYGAESSDRKNDEAVEVNSALPGIPVFCHPLRLEAAKQASGAGCDVAIMDDGFQHWQLQRLLDIVLLDGTNPFGGGHLLPWGYLRESPKALMRADVVVVTRCNLADPEVLNDEFWKRLDELAPYASICKAQHEPIDLREMWADEPPLACEAIAGKRILAACGVGNPHAFFATLDRLGAILAEKCVFPDHHKYTKKDLDAMLVKARAAHVESIVLTEKDAVKLEALGKPRDANLPSFRALGIRFKLVEGEAEFWKRVASVLRAATPKIQGRT